MAVLNKIRQRSVFLIIVIALALFAFVLADVIRNGGFSTQSSQNTIGTVNGEKISREEFARQVEAFQRNAGSNASTTQAVNQVWEQTLRELIFEEELEKLGIRAEQDQIRQIMRAQMANNPTFTNEAGVFDENRLREYVASIRATSPEAYQQWVQFENNLGGTARENIYMAMVTAGVGATLTEAEQAYRFENESVDLRFVQVPYSVISDDDVAVSKNEIRDYMKAHPAKFETEASRDIQYVFFEEKASEEDRKEARESLNDLLGRRVEFNAASNSSDTLAGFEETTEYAEFMEDFSDLPYENRFVFKNELPSAFSDAIFNLEEGEIYGPYEHDGYWKVTRMIEAKRIPDTAKASHILLSYQGAQYAQGETRSKEEARELADSLARVIRRDRSKFADLAVSFSSDVSNKDEGGDLGYFGPGDMVPEFDRFVFEKDQGDIDVIETDFGFHVISIEEQTDRVRAVKIATLAREIIPSERSGNRLFNQVTKFEIAARDGNFSEEAKKENLDVRTVKDMKGLDESIPGLGQQRRIVQWAFDQESEIGDVKRFDTSGGYVVAQLTAKKEKGLKRAEDASSEVLPILVNRKKAELIKGKLSGTSLEEIAASQNREVETARAINLANPTIPGAGREPAVVGASFALEQGEVSKPISGEKGVYVVELVKRNEAPARDSFRSLSDQETSRLRQQAAQGAYQALRKKAEIEDNRTRFY